MSAEFVLRMKEFTACVQRYFTFGGFEKAVDAAPYRSNSNIRLYGSCRESAKVISNTPKMAVQLGGVFVSKNNYLFENSLKADR